MGVRLIANQARQSLTDDGPPGAYPGRKRHQMQSMILLFVVLAIICAAPANKKRGKRASARGASIGRGSTTTISIRPQRQSAAKKPPAFDMAYEHDYAAEQYYVLADSLLRDAAREPDSTKSNRLRCRAAEAMLKADRHALKAQE